MLGHLSSDRTDICEEGVGGVGRLCYCYKDRAIRNRALPWDWLYRSIKYLYMYARTNK